MGVRGRAIILTSLAVCLADVPAATAQAQVNGDGRSAMLADHQAFSGTQSANRVFEGSVASATLRAPAPLSLADPISSLFRLEAEDGDQRLQAAMTQRLVPVPEGATLAYDWSEGSGAEIQGHLPQTPGQVADAIAAQPRRPEILHALHPASGAATPRLATADVARDLPPLPPPGVVAREIATAAVTALNAELAGGSASAAIEHMAEAWLADTSRREQTRLFTSMMDALDPERLFGLHSLAYRFSPRPGSAPDMSFMAIRPLGDVNDATQATFAQVSLNREEASGTTWNAGLAHRRILPGGVWMAGVNMFFDHAPRYGHHRVSLGIDAMTDRFSLSANRYMPLTDWRPSQPGYEQRALSGHDIELAGTLPGAPALRLTGKAWHWRTEEGADLRGDEFGLEYRPSGAMTLRVATHAGNDSPRQTVATLQLTYTLGVPLRRQLARTPTGTVPALASRLYENVRRENAIRTEERLIDVFPPDRYAIHFEAASLDDTNVTDVAIMLQDAEIGASYTLEIRNPTRPAVVVHRAGGVGAAQLRIGGLDLSVLADGPIEARLTLTDRAGNTGPVAVADIDKQTSAPVGAVLSTPEQAVNLANASTFSFELDTGPAWQTFSFVIRREGGSGSVVTGQGQVHNGILAVDPIDLNALPDGMLAVDITLASAGGGGNAMLTFGLLKDVVVPTVIALDVFEETGDADI